MDILNSKRFPFNRNNSERKEDVENLPSKTGGSFFSVRPFIIIPITVKDFLKNGGLLRAAALTYMSIFSLVPFLAIAFSLFKAFGGLDDLRRRLESQLFSFLSPGAQDRVQEFLTKSIENINAGAIGSFGFILLLVTSILLLINIETALNLIWRATGDRSFIRKMTTYWTALTIGPVLIAISLAIMAYMGSSIIFSYINTHTSVDFLGIISYLFICIALSALYYFIPTTRVKILSALLGGSIAALLWHFASWAYSIYTTKFVAYSRIYGSLGAIPVLFLWIYICWVIFLLGAEIAYVHQILGPSYILGNENSKEKINLHFLGLKILYIIGDAFIKGKAPLSMEKIIQNGNLPPDTAGEIVEKLQKEKILLKITNSSDSYTLAKPLDKIVISDIFTLLTGKLPDTLKIPEDKRLIQFFEKGNKAFFQATGCHNIAQLIEFINSFKENKSTSV